MSVPADDLEDKIKDSNILIVDDNPANVALLESILAEEGYESVVSTVDPRMVLPLCRKETFDVILLDIRMPYMTGLEVMEKLRDVVAPGDYLPVLVLTAQTDMQTRRDALKLGARDFVTKPFEQWEVMLRIRNMLETRYFFKRQLIRGDLLEEEVRKRTEEIREVQLEIIRRLSLAGEYRDDNTGAHVTRVSRMAEVIARGLGLDEKTCELIRYASALHDIGKIGIPDGVLLKPGPLDYAARVVMNRHTAIGQEIVGHYPSELIAMAGKIACSHHEKWDGSGYPNGLKGEDIPLCARIAAIADVFDALISWRPYKEPWTPEKAAQLIREEAGKHFDPALVEIFFGHFDEILTIQRELVDKIKTSLPPR
jgi:putative two-component system response regulator